MHGFNLGFMIPVYGVSQLREADSQTIRNQQITSWQLMERAAKACLPFLLRHERQAVEEGLPRPVFEVFCSKGNNGGDGLALACLLAEAGAKARVWMVEREGTWSPDAERNYRRWAGMGGVVRPIGPGTREELDSCEDSGKGSGSAARRGIVSRVLVDAMVGTGLRGGLDAPSALAAGIFNSTEGVKYSIDIPSGLLADCPTPADAVTVRGSFCLTFQFPKKAFLMPENAGRPYDFAILDIGLDPQYAAETEAGAYFLEEADVAALLPPRGKFSHKGDFGKTLVVAGSEGMCGAAILACRAAIRSGTGLARIVSCARNREILQACVPEAVYSSPETMRSQDWRNADALAFGPGIGTGPESRKLLKEVLQQAACPMVVDADGLNLLSADKTLLEYLPFGRTVFTPHLGEFERLAGPCADSAERWEKQQAFSNRYGAVVVLKGAHTSISLPGAGNLPLLFNSTGNPGMAAGGSGDVLSGVILALLGQGLTPYQAAYAGVYLHGLAADLAVEDLGEYGLSASDIADYLPRAFLQVQGKNRPYRAGRSGATCESRFGRTGCAGCNSPSGPAFPENRALP